MSYVLALLLVANPYAPFTILELDPEISRGYVLTEDYTIRFPDGDVLDMVPESVLMFPTTVEYVDAVMNHYLQLPTLIERREARIRADILDRVVKHSLSFTPPEDGASWALVRNIIIVAVVGSLVMTAGGVLVGLHVGGQL
jgi:hypothetical protein